jgi:hypothetical protein
MKQLINLLFIFIMIPLAVAMEFNDGTPVYLEYDSITCGGSCNGSNLWIDKGAYTELIDKKDIYIENESITFGDRNSFSSKGVFEWNDGMQYAGSTLFFNEKFSVHEFYLLGSDGDNLDVANYGDTGTYDEDLTLTAGNTLTLRPQFSNVNGYADIGMLNYNWHDIYMTDSIYFYNSYNSDKLDAQIISDKYTNSLNINSYSDNININALNQINFGSPIYANYPTYLEAGAEITSTDAPISIWENSTSRFLIDTSGNIGIGTETPEAKLHLLTTTQIAIISEKVSSDTGAAQFTYRKARGTPTAKTAVLSGDVLLNIGAQGYNGTHYSAGATASIRAFAEENFVGSARGTRITFSTTPKGSSNQVQRLYILESGNIGIATNTPSQKLDTAGYNNAYGYYTNSSKGISKTITVNTGLTTCTLIFTGGIVTGGTC